jgi:WD40 repeat protein
MIGLRANPRRDADADDASSAFGEFSDALAQFHANTLRRHGLFERLTDSAHLWWRCCRAAVSSRPGWLNQDQASEALRVIRREEPPQCGGAMIDAAESVLWIGRALSAAGHAANGGSWSPVPELDAEAAQRYLLSEAASRWRNGPAMPMPKNRKPFLPDKAARRMPANFKNQTRALLALLEDPGQDKGKAMVAVCALMLAGTRPTRRAVGVRVVLAIRSGHQAEPGTGDPVDGVTGTLELRELPGGPPGLFPDPSAMRVHRADAKFNQALELAWDFTAQDDERRCVLWRVILDADAPDFAIDGGSLGAAFAIALQELLHKRPISGLLTLTTFRGFLAGLRPGCAVTGELSTQPPAAYTGMTNRDKQPWLAAVDEMDAKLNAARQSHLRVVAPEANRLGRISDEAHVYWARTLVQADRYARRIYVTRTALTGLAALALIGSSVGAALALGYHGTAQRQHMAAVSALLTSTANGVHSTNPALAAQLDIAAYRDFPNANAYTSMLNDEDAPLDTIIPTGADALALSPDGGELAEVSLPGPITLRDIADLGQSPVSLGTLSAAGATGTPTVGFAPTGKILAVAAQGGGIRLWDVQNSAHPTPLSPTFGTAVTSLAFSPGGTIIATGTQQGAIQLWNISDPGRPAALTSRLPAVGSTGSYISALMFNASGRILYSGSLSGGVDVWNTAAPARPRLISQPVPGVAGQQDEVTFSQVGTAVITDGSGNTFLYDLGAQGSPQSITGGAAIISPDGLTIATRDQAGNITLLNTTQPLDYPLGSPLPVLSPTGEGSASPGPMVFDANGNLLAAGDNGPIMLWYLPHGYHADPALPLSQVLEPDSTDGGVAAIADGNDVLIQHLATGTSATHLISGTSPSLGQAVPALGDDGHLLAFADGNGSTSLWNLTDPAHPVPVGRPVPASGTNLALSEDGRILAVTTRDGSTSLWNLADPAQPTPFGGRIASDTVLAALSPDGRTLALLDSTDSVQLWNLADPSRPLRIGTAIRLGDGRSDAIATTALALSPGGTMLAVATAAGTIRLWSLGSRPATYGEPLMSNFDSFYNYLVTRVDSTGVNSVAFSPDGQTLTAINADSTIRIWDLNAASAAGNICAATHQALTAAIWNQYLPGVPYQAPCPTDQDRSGPGPAQAAPAPGAGATGATPHLCTANDISLSIGAALTSQFPVEPTAPLILTNVSHAACTLTGIPSVNLVGPPDPPLGGTYQLTSTAVPGQAPLTVPAGGKAHVNLTYLRAQFEGGGGGDWVPQIVELILPGTHSTLTVRWKSGEPVVRQDMASTKGTFTGPFLPNSSGSIQPSTPSTSPASSPPASAASLASPATWCGTAGIGDFLQKVYIVQGSTGCNIVISTLFDYGQTLLEQPGSAGAVTVDGWSCSHKNVPESRANGVWATCTQDGITIESKAG